MTEIESPFLEWGSEWYGKKTWVLTVSAKIDDDNVSREGVKVKMTRLRIDGKQKNSHDSETMLSFSLYLLVFYLWNNSNYTSIILSYYCYRFAHMKNVWRCGDFKFQSFRFSHDVVRHRLWVCLEGWLNIIIKKVHLVLKTSQWLFFIFSFHFAVESRIS